MQRWLGSTASVFACLLALAVSFSARAQTPCDADVNGDGMVSAADLAEVLGTWGSCAGCPSDISGDGIVDGIDLSAVLGYWGQPCLGPTISAVGPRSGPTGGGSAITITGTNLTGTKSVTIGGVAATSVTVVNATTVTAIAPAGVPGGKTVSVTTPNGTASLTNGFVYLTTQSWGLVLDGLPDPALVPNPALRDAIIATGHPWRMRDNITQLELVLIPPGTFNMGCSASTSSPCGSDGTPDTPVHAVTLTSAFYIGRHETTQSQWQIRMGSNPSFFQGNSQRPVEQVSWFSVQSYLNGTGLRLPTEAEWEYACRAGTTTAFHGFTGYPSGTNDDALVGNIAWWGSCCGGNSGGQTRPVGGKAPNGFGLHDMSGNVGEWVDDWYSSSYYASSTSANPTGPAFGTDRVVRGGTWFDFSGNVRSSRRGFNSPGATSSNFGFRAARSPDGWSTISSVSPNNGPTSGGTLITITGTNLTGTSSVMIDGAAATSVSVVNATTVTAVTPAGTTGAKSVSLTTPGGTASLTNGFTYVWYTVLEQNPDPAVVTSATLRDAITATGYPWRVRDNGTQIEMVLIPPGTFMMGCSASTEVSCGTGETPVHSVTLTSGFYIGRYEVTQAQWQARMGSNPAFFQPPNTAAAEPNRPVEQVSWNMVAGTGGFLSGTGLRLPTEAEWEYAYRAGTTTAFHGFTGYLSGTNNDALVVNIAWYNGGSASQTRPVGLLRANGFGLHDMSGNVWEWVNDWFSADYYASSPSSNPAGPATGNFRVLRGGSWNNIAGAARSSGRAGGTAGGADDVIGFRVARSPL